MFGVTDVSTIELVGAAFDGDLESFGELCRRHYTAMAAIAYSVLIDHQLAEDAAQETFARALTNLRSLKKPVKFVPWLGAICRNVARDMLKAGSRQVDTGNLSRRSDGEVQGGDMRAVRQAVGRLPESERDVVVLKYYNGFSYDQISAVLGISKPAVNGRLTRAKRKLTTYLKDSGFLENER
ncbi:MAG: RNA polymerase sigma factor [Phycisphaerales bacterium]|nr:MAG: RNA polymerase sigma factor [Phycisphaerales bacterium]